jgi:hypothetical protein
VCREFYSTNFFQEFLERLQIFSKKVEKKLKGGGKKKNYTGVKFWTRESRSRVFGAQIFLSSFLFFSPRRISSKFLELWSSFLLLSEIKIKKGKKGKGFNKGERREQEGTPTKGRGGNKREHQQRGEEGTRGNT